ncbi:MAG: hypothetical protein Greene041619_769 [Candidatus Peregrinibacteria bacterium Greene0416_19]|nr:MAG: hypothetical protein Greene041619_769 [Candidatus Peregrinibacteria bacterium Greene0416_19]
MDASPPASHSFPNTYICRPHIDMLSSMATVTMTLTRSSPPRRQKYSIAEPRWMTKQLEAMERPS